MTQNHASYNSRRLEATTTRVAGALLLATIATSLAACEEAEPLVTCETVIGELYDNGHALVDEQQQPLDVEEAGALCTALEADALEAGCQAELDRWLDCLEEPADASPICHRELLATTACRDDDPYEYACADGEDNDDDGDDDCADEDCHDSVECAFTGLLVPQSVDPAADILFVVDFHDTAAEERAQLQTQLHYLFDELRDAQNTLPDLHIGIVTPALGVLGQSVPDCAEPAAGEAGRMQPGGCTGMGGASYFIDVAPQGCELTREDTWGRCTAHDCLETHCGHEPLATLVLDENDCPRCRNFGGVLPENLFDCVVGLTPTPCPYRQPLEAMRFALDDHPDNTGFVRERARLSVVLLSNADDCSAADAQLFDAAHTELGPLTTFRCFEYGATCDEGGRDAGVRHNCAPSSGSGSDLLHPLGRYTDFLTTLKHPHLLTVAAIGGPVPDDGISVTLDASGFPTLSSGCQPAQGYAAPAVRLRGFSDHFNDLDGQFWPFSPSCGELGAALMGVGETLAAQLAPPCLEAPLLGCTDPGAALGDPWDDETCNDACLPDCRVVEAYDHDTPQETRARIWPCLEVCDDGPCPGNTDPVAAYEGARPDDRDPALPVDACWYVVSEPACAESHGALIRIARRQDPPPRTFAYVSCVHAPPTETECDDFLDNDGDCLFDLDDPDCGG